MVAPAETLPRIDRREGVIRSGRLAGLTMWHAIWVISWPVLVESLLTSLVGVVDVTLSAGVSEAAADAVGGGAYFMWFIGLVSIALGVGAVALISRAMGRGRLAVGSTVVGQCTTLSLVSGVGMAILISLAAPVVAWSLSLSDGARAGAVLYIRLCALAVPLQTFAQVGIACCRGAGDSYRPLKVMAVVNLVNIAVSFLLSGVDVAVATRGGAGEPARRVLFENPSPFNLGVAGIALGTAVAWTVGGVVMLWMLIGGVQGVRLRLRRLRPHWHTIRRLVRIGLPNMSETFSLWFGNFLVIVMLGWLRDPGVLGANVIAVRIEAFSFLPGFAMSLAAATLAGTYLGAGSARLAVRAVLRCQLIASAMMGLIGLAFILVPREITGVFTQQPTHLALAPEALRITGLIQVVFSVSIVLRGALRGAGDTASVMWISWISIWAIRLPLAWLGCGVDLPLPGGLSIPNPAPLQSMGVHPLIGMWIGLCVEIVIRSAMFVYVFVRGEWTRKRV